MSASVAPQPFDLASLASARAEDVEWPAAIEAFRAVLGPGGVDDSGDGIAAAERNAGAVQRKVSCLLRPRSTADVVGIVEVANRLRVPLYAFSTGRNWGMGSRLPVRDGGALVDLGGMDRIERVDPRGFAVIEAGVTQGALHARLQHDGLPLFLDPTGSASYTSYVGNVLERGIGYFAPRFQTLLGLEVVLGNGTVVRTGYWHDERVTDPWALPYGVGPYLDGLFTQSNYGIVTRAVIALHQRPERFSSFWARLSDESRLPDLIDALRGLRRSGALKSVVHVADKQRSGSALLPLLGVPSPGIARAAELPGADPNAVLPWSAIGPIWGPASMVRAAESECKRGLRGICDVQIVTERKVELAMTVLGALSFVPACARLLRTARAAAPLMAYSRGIPSDAALPSVFWPIEDVPQGRLEPDHSNSGVLYVLPAVPFDGASAAKAVQITRRTAAEHGLPSYITLNTMTDHALEGVLNVAFDRRAPAQVDAAHRAVDAMLEQFYAAGFPPYRVGIQQLGRVLRADDPFWVTVARLKAALDPHGIIAPGRYNLV